MKKILVFVAILALNAHLTMAAAPADERAKKCSTGHDLLKQHKYQEARTALEACLQKAPANAMAQFYLGDACQGLKAWACAEAHYETSLELDAKSSVAGLAKQRGRKAKVWRLLDEGKQAIGEPNAPPKQIAQAEDTLEIANTLGLDDEQRAVYQQLQGKIQQRHKVNHVNPPLAKQDERSMVLVPAGEFTMGSLAGDADERPVHRVYVDAFFMDTYQLSVGQYATFLEATSHAVTAGMEHHEPSYAPEAPRRQCGLGGCGRVLHMGRQTPADRGGVGEGGPGNGWPGLSLGESASDRVTRDHDEREVEHSLGSVASRDV